MESGSGEGSGDCAPVVQQGGHRAEQHRAMARTLQELEAAVEDGAARTGSKSGADPIPPRAARRAPLTEWAFTTSAVACDQRRPL